MEAMSLAALMADAWLTGGRLGRLTASVASCMALPVAYLLVQQSWDACTEW